ncbi:MAG: DMT family transporter [Chloroflexi bacterium]|nr:DMT family transporter [Chloroflexota bacterium]MBU1660583.1 DMT family transporter [Chloroflexota bacterium]
MDILDLLAGLAAAAIWGGMYVVSKVLLDIIPPFALLSLRLLMGALTLLPFVLRRGGIGFTRRQMVQVLGVGLVGYGVSLGFQFLGTKLSTAANGALVTSATPAFVLLFAAWILGERINRRRLLALGLATLGVIIVLDPRNARLSPDLFWGNLSLIGAALTWALYSVLIRKVTRGGTFSTGGGLDVLSVSLICFLGGLPLTIPAAAWELGASGMGAITPWVVAGIIYLGVISTGLAMYLWNTAFARLEAGVASLTFFAQPVVGAGLGAIFLGEQLTPLFLLGGGLIGLGLVLAARQTGDGGLRTDDR